jgi:hypothetical protein
MHFQKVLGRLKACIVWNMLVNFQTNIKYWFPRSHTTLLWNQREPKMHFLMFFCNCQYLHSISPHFAGQSSAKRLLILTKVWCLSSWNGKEILLRFKNEVHICLLKVQLQLAQLNGWKFLSALYTYSWLK